MKFKIVKRLEWEQPVMKGYRMKCCDCGLVHIVDFRIATSIHARRDKNGLVNLEKDGHVQLRMKRA